MSYKLNDTYDWGTGRLYSAISVVPYEDYTQVWTNRANRTNHPALFSTTAQNASILDSTGAVAATIKNGELTANRSDVTPILSCGMTLDGYVPTSNSAAMWLPAGQYTLETTGGSKEFTAVLADVEQSAAVTAPRSSLTYMVFTL